MCGSSTLFRTSYSSTDISVSTNKWTRRGNGKMGNKGTLSGESYYNIRINICENSRILDNKYK